jgi:hypothetical protein
MNNHEQSWTIMNNHEQSWTIMNNHEDINFFIYLFFYFIFFLWMEFHFTEHTRVRTYDLIITTHETYRQTWEISPWTQFMKIWFSHTHNHNHTYIYLRSFWTPSFDGGPMTIVQQELLQHFNKKQSQEVCNVTCASNLNYEIFMNTHVLPAWSSDIWNK